MAVLVLWGKWGSLTRGPGYLWLFVVVGFLRTIALPDATSNPIKVDLILQNSGAPEFGANHFGGGVFGANPIGPSFD